MIGIIVPLYACPEGTVYMDHYFDQDNIEQFDELIKNSRRVNILDGHYKSVWYLENNKDKVVFNISLADFYRMTKQYDQAIYKKQNYF